MILKNAFILLLALGVPGLTSCNKSDKSEAKKSGTDDEDESEDSESAKDGDGDAADATTAVSDANDGFFTGFDGTTDYSLLVPRFREMTLEDPSIAKVESVKVTLSVAIITELLAAAKKDNPSFEDARFRKSLAREQTVYRITPLKAGKTAIKTTGGRGGKAGRQQSGWQKSPNINLTVTAYTAAQLADGKKRYHEDGSGNLKACKACHETGAEGAPPHELGKIMEVSDKGALTWIKTGKLEGRVAKVAHTWEFSTAAEEKGIVAYLRSKQTHDVETLTKLYVEEQLANGGFMPGGGGRKPADADTEAKPAAE